MEMAYKSSGKDFTRGSLSQVQLGLGVFVLILYKKIQIERRFAAKHGCQPLRAWKAKWPLGLDMLMKAFNYSRRMQILQFFLEVVDTSGTTFEQNLLGARGIDTIDPRNIEAILSTNFDGPLLVLVA